MARFWRLIGLSPLGNSNLVAASAVHLLSAADVRLDSDATLSLEGAIPVRGSVADLQSDDFQAECAWPHEAPGVALLWDFGVGNDVQVEKLLLGGSAAASDFLSRFVLQSSNDGIAWVTQWSLFDIGLRWPGAFVSSGAISVGAGMLDSNARILAPMDAGVNLAENLISGASLEIGGNLTAATGGLRGGTAAVFDGNSARLTVAGSYLVFGSSDWTVDFWKFTSNINRNHCFLRGDAGGLTTSAELGLSIRHDADYFVVYVNGGIQYRILSTSAKSKMAAGRWQHIAVSRVGNQLRLFIDGLLAEQSNIAGAVATATAWRIGYDSYNPSNSLQGLLQDYRVTIGKALYTEPFTPDASGIRPDARFLIASINSQKSRFFGISFGDQAFSLANALSAAMDTEFGGRGVIHGTVEQKLTGDTTLPLKRRVRLHRSRDGLLVRETWSKADGSYEFTDISMQYEYDTIAWDHEMSYRSVIANNLKPEAM